MIADETAHLRLTGRHLPAADRHDDFAVIVAQIACLGPGPYVDPLAEVAVAEEAFVILVGKALHDAGFDLATNPATRAERRAPADLRAHDLRASANVAWTLETRERANVS